VQISDWPNWFGLVAAAGTTGLFAYLTMRRSKHYDARQASEAAMWGIGPKIIEELNKRIINQDKRIESQDKRIEDTDKLHQQCRSDLLSMTQEVRELRWQLQQAGIISIPPRKLDDGTIE
jgi:uncharacterized coiled-coil protein SlyX